MKSNIVFTDTKLSSKFNVHDPVPFTKKHYGIYWSGCVTENCNEDYAGEWARRLNERVKDYNSRDHSSHLVKHPVETGYLPVENGYFEVIGSGYRNNAHRRKIAKALLVHKLKIQEKLIPLKIFN